MVKRPLCLVCLVIVLLMYIGVHISGVPYIDLGDCKGTTVTIVGRVVDKAIKNDSQVVYLDNISFEGSIDQALKQSIEQSLKQSFEVSPSSNLLTIKKQNIAAICYIESDMPRIGDYVKLTGQIRDFDYATNPGEFDLRKYYGISGYYFSIYKARIIATSYTSYGYVEGLYNLKCRLSTIYDRYLDEVDASVIKAMVLGDKGNLDNETKDLYRDSGIAHLLAISGLHVSLIGMLVYKFLKKIRLPEAIAVTASIFIMINYGLMTGLSGSLMRALVLFVMLVFSKLLRRCYDLCTALALAGLIIALINPYMLEYAGFAMSFGAVIGIGIFSRCLEVKLPIKNNLCNLAVKGLLSSLAVNFFTLPLMLRYYYQYPLYSIFINLLLVPFMTILLVAALVLGLLGLIGIKLCALAALLCHYILLLYKIVCQGFGRLPYSHIVLGKPHAVKMILFYVGTFALYFADKQKKRREFVRTRRLMYEKSMLDKAIKRFGESFNGRARLDELINSLSEPVKQIPLWRKLIVMALLVILLVPFRLGLRVEMLDVGQGDGICITNGGHTYMIDAGSSDNARLAEYVLLPYLKSRGISTIDCWFVSHPDKDHISALMDILTLEDGGGINIRCICLPRVQSIEEDASELISLASEKGIRIRYLAKGDSISDGKASFTCISPISDHHYLDTNDYSLVLLFSYEGTKVLFTGDASTGSEMLYMEAMEEMGISINDIDILKCGHHGSKSATSSELVERARPRCALISSGRNNSYGHPHREVLSLLDDYGVKICNTQQMGAIRIDLKKNSFKITSFL